jgi:hypothetical protein
MPASDHLSPDQYRGIHQPQADDESPAIHNLDELFGPDVYKNPHFFGHGDRVHDREAAVALRRAHNSPESNVDIFRAVPHGVTSINTGDWVTTSPSYARQHGYHESDESQDWPVLKATVPAKHVRTGGNDIIEWGYSGPSIDKAEVHHRGGR